MIIGRWVSATAELASRIVIDREALAVDVRRRHRHRPGRRHRAGAVRPAPRRTPGRRADVRLRPPRRLQAAQPRPRRRLRPAAGLGAAQAPPMAVTRAVTRGFAGLALRVLERGDHGWVEFVEQEACAGLAEVRLLRARRRPRLPHPRAARQRSPHGERHRDASRPGADRSRDAAAAGGQDRRVRGPGAAERRAGRHGRHRRHVAGRGRRELPHHRFRDDGRVERRRGVRSSAASGTGAGVAALAGRIWRDLDSTPSTSPTTPPSRLASATPCASTARSRRPTPSPPTCGTASTRPTACCWPIARRCSRRTARSPPSPARRSGCCRGRRRSASLIYLLSRPKLPEGRLPLEHGVRRAEPGGQRIARRARGLAGAGQRAQGARGARRPALHRRRRRHRRPHRPARADRAALCPIRAGRREGSRRRLSPGDLQSQLVHRPRAVGDDPQPLFDRARARRAHRARRHLARLRRPRAVDRASWSIAASRPRTASATPAGR